MIYTSKIEKPTDPSTNQNYVQLFGRADKRLLVEAKDNRERLCKVVYNCPADPTNNCLMKPRTIKNDYAKDLIVTNHLYRQAKTKNN